MTTSFGLGVVGMWDDEHEGKDVSRGPECTFPTRRSKTAKTFMEPLQPQRSTVLKEIWSGGRKSKNKIYFFLLLKMVNLTE